MARMDHQINTNNTWAVRWLREQSPQTNQLVATNYTRTRAEEEQDRRLDGRRHAELGDRQHAREHV